MLDLKIPCFDLVMCLSRMSDLVNPAVFDHKLQVAYISSRLAREYLLPESTREDLLIAGALHDIGALSLGERLHALRFDVDSPHAHAEFGYQLLRMFGPLERPAEYVRFHHVYWRNGEGLEHDGLPVPFESHLLHLADRVAVLLGSSSDILVRSADIREKIVAQSGKMFPPDLVEAFQTVAARESFWLDATSRDLDRIVYRLANTARIRLGVEELTRFTDIMRRVIDSRSRFTATHSAGVAAVAGSLAGAIGLSPLECTHMRIAGHLHDLGKLSVPTEILLKPGALTSEEFAEMRKHTYHSDRLLREIPGFATINEWASYHHEKLDGSGYPFHHDADRLSLGSRIMAVADIFTALTEDRPYRSGMEGRAAMKVLENTAQAGKIDAAVVDLLGNRFDTVNAVRVAAQTAARDEFERFELRAAYPEDAANSAPILVRG